MGGQQTVWYAGRVGEPANWLAMATRRPAEQVAVRDLPLLAAAHPDDAVLVGRTVCGEDGSVVRYSIELARDLASRPLTGLRGPNAMAAPTCP